MIINLTAQINMIKTTILNNRLCSVNLSNVLRAIWRHNYCRFCSSYFLWILHFYRLSFQSNSLQHFFCRIVLMFSAFFDHVFTAQVKYSWKIFFFKWDFNTVHIRKFLFYRFLDKKAVHKQSISCHDSIEDRSQTEDICCRR